MSEEPADGQAGNRLPTAEVHNRLGLSIIWVVPVIALLIGGWLTYQAWLEQGPTITITFESAEGLEADKTQIKFKDVAIGRVTGIDLNEDLSAVKVTAEMHKSMAPYMTDQARFWIVRARVAAGEVKGLGTLFTGAYIGCAPSREGEVTRRFEGLEKPPVLTGDRPGRHFALEADTLGSLDFGSPVYYRGIKVGQVVAYDFDSEAEAVNIRIFVEAPYHTKVRENTRFWNASGINMQLDPGGVQIDTQSLVSILLGGVAFDLPNHLDAGQPASPDAAFKLFANRESIDEQAYSLKRYYRMSFHQNVRGLSPGAPIEIFGIKVGEVVGVELKVDPDDLEARVEVLAMIEPQRIHKSNGAESPFDDTGNDISTPGRNSHILRMVDKGLRAQLKTSNLLTGQLYVDLAFHPDAPSVAAGDTGDYPLIPTVPTSLEQFTQRLDQILGRIEALPLQQIGEDLHTSIISVHETLQAYREVADDIDAGVVPRLNDALEQLRQTLDGVDATLGPQSALNENARRIGDELPLLIRSLRSLLDTLERDPQILLLGREKATP